jgi:uncharacterized protein (DUF433 family)
MQGHVSATPEFVVRAESVSYTQTLEMRRAGMHWQDRIIIDPEVLVGKPVIKGTRIAVEFVVGLLAQGWTVDQVLEEYDHLTSDDVLACLAYAADVLQSERVYSVPA